MFTSSVEQLPEPHPESVVVGTGKGGVGKTTVAAHLAGLSAAQGVDTLLVCVTSQEEDDFGISSANRGVRPDGDSVLDGAGLYRSLHDRRPLAPVREVRPHLDVVPGGRSVGQIQPMLTMRMMEDGPLVAASLAECLAPIAHRYGRIVFDSAPENDALEQLTLAAARWLAIPTRSDESSIRGLRRIAGNFKAVKRHINPHVDVAGAFLYASNPSATSVHAEVKRDVAALLGEDTPMLSTVVGYREAPSRLSRKRGLLFWEFADRLTSSPQGYDVAAGRARSQDVVPPAIKPLAVDMRNLCEEIFVHCKKGA